MKSVCILIALIGFVSSYPYPYRGGPPRPFGRGDPFMSPNGFLDAVFKYIYSDAQTAPTNRNPVPAVAQSQFVDSPSSYPTSTPTRDQFAREYGPAVEALRTSILRDQHPLRRPGSSQMIRIPSQQFTPPGGEVGSVTLGASLKFAPSPIGHHQLKKENFYREQHYPKPKPQASSTPVDIDYVDETEKPAPSDPKETTVHLPGTRFRNPKSQSTKEMSSVSFRKNPAFRHPFNDQDDSTDDQSSEGTRAFMSIIRTLTGRNSESKSKKAKEETTDGMLVRMARWVEAGSQLAYIPVGMYNMVSAVVKHMERTGMLDEMKDGIAHRLFADDSMWKP